MSIEKTVTVGIINHEHIGHVRNGATISLDVELKDSDKGQVLSISGNIGRSEFGQIQDTLKTALLANGIRFNEDWNDAKLAKLLSIWQNYHLNDMHAGCTHQRRILRVLEKLHDNLYMRDLYQDYSKLSSLPEFSECSECGYRYGTAWLYEPLPIEVIQWLRDQVFGHLDILV